MNFASRTDIHQVGAQLGSVRVGIEGGPTRPCPVCESEAAGFAFHAPAEHLGRSRPIPTRTYSYFECRQCESVFLGDLPSADELRQYYESDSYHSTTSPATTETPLRRLLTVLRRSHLHLSRPLPAGSHNALLDFGCGRGDYLDYARWRGWRPVGAEFSHASASLARQRGFDVALEDEIQDLTDGSFSHISMIHSLEHHPRPTAVLKLLAGKLTRDGKIFIELPSLDCHESRLFGTHYSMIQAPVHLQFFSDRTVEQLARRCNLELVAIRNNHWSPVYYVWSFLNLIEAKSRLRISRATKNRISALGFPITMWFSLVASLGSRPGAVRQYVLMHRSLV